MLNDIVLNMCFLIKDEIVKRVSGRVNFRSINFLNETDPYVVFKIEFKDFKYEHVVDVNRAMDTMSAKDIANYIVNDYKKSVNRTFFKK